MAPPILFPPVQLSHAAALEVAQTAPAVLKNSPSGFGSSSILSIFQGTEKSEQWIEYENLILTCLRTGDDKSARECLDRLVARFGADNERVQALNGLVKEATAKNPGELEAVLKEYDQILSENDTNIPIAKRRIALLRSLGRTSDAASALVQLLDFSPTDSEAWSELSDVYLSQGLYPQAIYALEEVLVLAPNAWNIHARLGELQYMAATASGATGGSYQKHMAEAIKRFSRSIELCDDYLRGYYGLKLVSKTLLNSDVKAGAKQNEEGDFTLPDKDTLEKLHELATAKLAEIVRRSTAKERGWRGYNEAEVAAARELLAEDTAAVKR